jgi:Animal haem peroxidase
MTRHHGQKPRGQDETSWSVAFEGRFGRMFPGIPFFETDKQFLRELADEMQEEQSADNERIPAGFTYLGQFIDHDLTFDPSSSLQKFSDPDALVNFRSPRLDLDCLYGRGPDDDPYLYNQGTPAGVHRPPLPDDEQDGDKHGVKFLLGRITDDDGSFAEGNGEGDDLPRGRQGRALIGDPRNDENTFISQLQLTFLKFHNRIVDHVAAEDGLAGSALFKEANRLARWHYQWIVVHEFLPLIVGDDALLGRAGRVEDGDLLGRLAIDRWGCETVTLRHYDHGRGYGDSSKPYMPVEFSVAAYRYGHSQIRPGYAINNLVRAPTFTSGRLDSRIQDFRGFRPLPRFWTVQWPFFFRLDDQNPQSTLKIDTKLAPPLFGLPQPEFDVSDSPDDEASLARRNLLRGLALKLPSGHRVARAVGVPKKRQVTRGERFAKRPCPLWFYVLKEAEEFNDGEQLGEVGATIVVETFLGVLDKDPLSYMSVEPCWKPTLPSEQEGHFTMADLIRFAAPEQAVRTEINP